MGTTPTSRAENVWQIGSDDMLQIVSEGGGAISWIDSNGLPQGNLATITSLPFSGVPTGACLSSEMAVDTTTGNFYDCLNAAWHFVGPGAIQTPVTAPNPFPFNTDVQFKGPNPYVDIRSYGARTVNPNTTPAAVGLTANCVSGSANAAISAASTFVNGDGVVLYGCGAPHSMSTPAAPTVVPAAALAGTGTGIVTTSVPVGSTTYNYKIIARDKNGGLTAASVAGSTTIGATALGAITVNIASMSRTNDARTVTTSVAHPLLVGCNPCGEVFIQGGNGLTDNTWRGWYLVSSVADSTHFTIAQEPFDTRNGASTSATGGSATFYLANHLTLPAVTGAWEYYIYSDRANPGTFALVGVSRPQGATNTDLTWDDFGSPMMDNFSFPPYVPTSPPSSATSDHLVTTIASGAGTTSLTLANAAGTTVSGATIRFTNGPALVAAATAINAGGSHAGTLVIPADNTGNSFVVNNYVNLSALNIAISQIGPLFLNETFETKARWYGDRSPQYGNQNGSDIWQGNPVISVGTAIPGIYNPQQTGAVLQGVAMSGSGNGALLALYEGGFNMSFIGDSFVTASGNSDYMGIGLYLRGSTGQSATNVIIDRTLFSTAGPSVDGATHTPAWYCNLCGQGQVRSAYYLHRGAVINGVTAGGAWKIDHSYINGGFTPLYTFTGGSNNWGVISNQITMDTIAHPCYVAFSPGSIIAPSGGPCGPSSGVPSVTGLRVPLLGETSLGSVNSPIVQNRDSMGPICQNGGALDGIFGSSASAYCVNANNMALATGTNYPIFVNGAKPVAPTCAVSAGGSVPVGTYQFAVVPVWQNNGEGSYSGLSNACTTTPGNQTITITNGGTPGGNPKGINLYYCNSNGTNCTGGLASGDTFSNPQAINWTTFAWSSLSFNAGSSPGNSVPAGGPTMLMPGLQGISSAGPIILAPTSFANLGTPINGTFKYCFDCTVANPCAGSGTGAFAKRLNGVWACN